MAAMGNPVLHMYPGNPLSPAHMHREINKAHHADCTLHTCEMLRACWTRLLDLGHMHPDDPAEDCPVCARSAL